MESFIYYKSFVDAMEILSIEEYGEVAKAINRYAIYGEEPDELSDKAKIVFIMAKPQLDANSERKNNGIKGGRPKKTYGFENEKPMVIENETYGFENEKPMVIESEIENETSGFENEKPNVNVNENVNVNVNVNANENVNENEIKASKDALSETDAAKSDVQAVTDAWNKTSFREITRISSTSKRYGMLKARIKEHGLDKVLKAIDKANDSTYLHSEKAVSWFDFDWFIRPNNFPRVLEGKYDNRNGPNEPDGNEWRWKL